MNPQAQEVRAEELDEEKIRSLFYEIIEKLSKQAREEFANQFEEELEGIITNVAISKARKGQIHLSNRTIIEAVLASSEARKWVLRKAEEEARKTLEIVKFLERNEPAIEKIVRENEQEEVDEDD
ncbi:MAG: hypothetical protein JHC26_00530 [Thermofilum sp.]|uniref:hypothetical protein n=1 Tax=Thermofilum sp. TaxID=1961369 RepID=UPI00258F7B7C|nr:hypothetical protein [Thermofilum sp.]MCI4407551.1 hypothetical protein [Thermofilum sp.]